MFPSVCTAEPPCGHEPAAVRPLVGLLHQLFDLIEALTDDEYTRKPVGVVESSIGGHVRHDLDHIAALLRGLPTGELCYDHRDRGTDVEHDRAAALDAILRLEDELLAFAWDELPRVVTLSAPMSNATVARRETRFCDSKTNCSRSRGMNSPGSSRSRHWSHRTCRRFSRSPARSGNWRSS